MYIYIIDIQGVLEILSKTLREDMRHHKNSGLYSDGRKRFPGAVEMTQSTKKDRTRIRREKYL